MSQRIVIDPVTRIEGHAKISIFMDDAGNVSDAEFHVVEFRGFEKFCEGRPYTEMPGITPRICGICPVSHLLASAKAGDAIMAVNIPPAAEKLRRLMNLGGKKIHPAWAVPGGVRSSLTEEGRARIRAWLPEAFATTKIAFDLFAKTMDTHQREIQIFGNFPSLFMGMVTPDGSWEH